MRSARMLITTAITLVFAAPALAPALAQQQQPQAAEEVNQAEQALQQAQAQETQQPQGQQGQQQGDGNKIDIVSWAQTDLYQGWTAEQLFDTPVYGIDGEDIGEVENLVISADGQLESIIVEAGGFWDIGDTHFAVPWEDVEFERGLEWLRVPVDEDNVPNFSLFGDDDEAETGPREFRATELLNDYVSLEGGVGYGLIEDLAFDPDGELIAVVVYPDVGYGVGGPRAYPYYGYDYGWEPGAETYAMPYAEGEIAELGPFDYERFQAPVPGTRTPGQADGETQQNQG